MVMALRAPTLGSESHRREKDQVGRPSKGAAPECLRVNRLRDPVGHATTEEMWGIDDGLQTVLGLR